MAEGERIPHNRGMRDLAIVTVVAKNYWSFACVLAQSLRHYHPNL
jgi:hypothetical protein